MDITTPSSTRPTADRPSRLRLRPGRRAAATDEELLDRIREGDSGAADELYRRHHGAVRRFAARLVPRDDLDDVVSETFSRTLRAIDGGRGPRDEPIRYLMVTARTVAVSHYARAARATQLTERLAGEPHLEVGPALDRDPYLSQAMQALSPRWQRVLWMTEIEGRSPGEVGDELGLSASAAAALSYRARRALRTQYELLVDEASAQAC